MRFTCIGCNSTVGWDGKSSPGYSCPCGGQIFWDNEKQTIAAAPSLVVAIKAREDLPHLDHLVGRSDFTSPFKERLIEQLTALGAVWMKDCEQCLGDGTYQRQLDREESGGESDSPLRSTPCGHGS